MLRRGSASDEDSDLAVDSLTVPVARWQTRVSVTHTHTREGRTEGRTRARGGARTGAHGACTSAHTGRTQVHARVYLCSMAYTCERTHTHTRRCTEGRARARGRACTGAPWSVHRRTHGAHAGAHTRSGPRGEGGSVHSLLRVRVARNSPEYPAAGLSLSPALVFLGVARVARALAHLPVSAERILRGEGLEESLHAHVRVRRAALYPSLHGRLAAPCRPT